MDIIRAYQKLSSIKPEFHKLNMPINTPSIKRINFNQQEIELYYNKEFGSYFSMSAHKKGGFDEDSKIKVIDFGDFEDLEY